MSLAWSLGRGVFLASALMACSSSPGAEDDSDEGALAETTPGAPAASTSKQHVFVTSGEGKKVEGDSRMTYFESAREKKVVAMVVCSRDDRSVDYSVMDSAAPMSSNTIVTGRYAVPSGETCTKLVERLSIDVLSGKVAIRVRVSGEAPPEIQSLEAIDHRATTPCDKGTYLKPDGFCG